MMFDDLLNNYVLPVIYRVKLEGLLCLGGLWFFALASLYHGYRRLRGLLAGAVITAATFYFLGVSLRVMACLPIVLLLIGTFGLTKNSGRA
jgi:hypothetical protein